MGPVTYCFKVWVYYYSGMMSSTDQQLPVTEKILTLQIVLRRRACSMTALQVKAGICQEADGAAGKCEQEPLLWFLW